MSGTNAALVQSKSGAPQGTHGHQPHSLGAQFSTQHKCVLTGMWRPRWHCNFGDDYTVQKQLMNIDSGPFIPLSRHLPGPHCPSAPCAQSQSSKELSSVERNRRLTPQILAGTPAVGTRQVDSATGEESAPRAKSSRVIQL